LIIGLVIPVFGLAGGVNQLFLLAYHQFSPPCKAKWSASLPVQGLGCLLLSSRRRGQILIAGLRQWSAVADGSR